MKAGGKKSESRLNLKTEQCTIKGERDMKSTLLKKKIEVHKN